MLLSSDKTILQLILISCHYIFLLYTLFPQSIYSFDSTTYTVFNTVLFKLVNAGNTIGFTSDLFEWFGISCMTTDNFCFYLQNRQIQTSQTGGQWYSDTPYSTPW
jgi:hypothetical protein